MAAAVFIIHSEIAQGLLPASTILDPGTVAEVRGALAAHVRASDADFQVGTGLRKQKRARRAPTKLFGPFCFVIL